MLKLIVDSGPLFSLASADLLPVLLHFNIIITDVVKAETFDYGLNGSCSKEIASMIEFYNLHGAAIDVRNTQFGNLLLKQKPPCLPKNAGELSIQSLLINLQQFDLNGETPVILFEDNWFTAHANQLTRPCKLISTLAFLDFLETLKIIPSAAKALLTMQNNGRKPNPISVQWNSENK